MTKEVSDAVQALDNAQTSCGEALSSIGVKHPQAFALVQVLAILGRLIKALKKLLD